MSNNNKDSLVFKEQKCKPNSKGCIKMTQTMLILKPNREFELQDKKGELHAHSIKKWNMPCSGTYTMYYGTYQVAEKGTILNLKLVCTVAEDIKSDKGVTTKEKTDADICI